VTVVLLGGGGLLGSGVRALLADSGRACTWVRPPWHDPRQLEARLRQVLPALLLADEPVELVWAAGTGGVGATEASMAAETEAVRAVCELVATLPVDRRSEVSVLFASSAGALFAGHGATQIDDDAVPAPTSPYGRGKLEQERLLASLAESTGSRVVAARISNVVGLASGRLTARGLVSTAVRATRLRQPMTVFVSPDVRRDYVFNRDAAALALRALCEAGPGFSTALVRDGQTRTVSEVLGVVARVSGRRVPAVFAERPETRLQPPALRFAPPPRGADAVRRTPMEVAIHLMMRAPMTA
jgi:UDP-glucose 4-epimerase